MMVDGTFVLPIISLAEQCHRYGKILIELYQSYKNADKEIDESTVQIEIYWLGLRRKLDFLQRVWPDLDDKSRSLYDRVLQILYGKLQAAIILINSVIKESEELPSTGSIFRTGETRAAKYSLQVKESLQSSIQVLKAWSELYDVSVLVMTGASNQQMDQKLATEPVEVGGGAILTLKALRLVAMPCNRQGPETSSPSIFLPRERVMTEKTPITHSMSELWDVKLGIEGAPMNLIVDEKLTTDQDMLPDVRALARLLQDVDPFIFGILPCERVFQSHLDGERFIDCNFAFKIPKNLHQPRSLRQMLLADEDYRDLNEKFHLAKHLAKSVFFVHSAKFVHKNIRPDTIVILEDRESALKWPFLIGFDRFRAIGARTQREGDDFWEKNMYRHPYRQGTHPEVDYIMQHDIYSLGVCLLEIGMGTSFATWKAEYSSIVAHPYPKVLAAEVNSTVKQNQKRKAFSIKRCLVNLAEAELPLKMGRSYTDIVVTCLTCLDQTGNRFGSEADYYDADGILVGVRYIEKASLVTAVCKPESNNYRYSSRFKKLVFELQQWFP